eukprot:Stramenopile-MAST_4_protein_2898
MQAWVKQESQTNGETDYDRSVTKSTFEDRTQTYVASAFAEAEKAKAEKKRLEDLAAIEAAKPEIKKLYSGVRSSEAEVEEEFEYTLHKLRKMHPPTWVPDTSAQSCYACARPFDWLRRKHHCRLCGYIFCGECTEKRSMLPETFELRKPGRVCDACHDAIEPLQQELIETRSLQNRENTLYDAERSGRHINVPYKRTLSGEIRKAAYALRNCFHGQQPDRAMMEKVLKHAHGLAFITVLKGGFIVAGRAGTGLVISRLESGLWSAPSAIGTFGMSWGAQIGGDLTDFIVVLTSKAAVDAFTGTGTIARIGASVGATIGVGRKAEADVHLGRKGNYVSHVYTYAKTKGVYAGVAFEFGGIRTRNALNRRFYGFDVSPKDLLSGNIPQPKAGKPLYDELNEVFMYLDSENPLKEGSSALAASVNFARKNPGITKKAVRFAQENPDIAKSAGKVAVNSLV